MKLCSWEARYSNLGTRSNGLGLLLVREFVRSQQGKLLIDSAPGNGATFRIQLPKL